MANEILPRHIFFGFVVFVLFISGFVSIIYEVGTVRPNILLDGSGNVSQFNTSFNKFLEIKNASESLQEDIEEYETSSGLFGFIDKLIGDSYTTLKSFFSIMSFVPDIFNALEENFGIPWWAAGAGIMLVMSLLIFAILTVVFQREI